MAKKSRSWLIWLLLGVLGLATFILFYNDAFPVASIDITLSKQDVLERASNFIKNQGFSLEGFDNTILFSSDYHASIYLQKTQGIKKSNQLIRKEIPVWFWRVRWFKELEKEGFVVDVHPTTGEVVHFYHSILDDQGGQNLPQKVARRMAEEKLAGCGINLDAYELKDSTKKSQKNRTDYSFVWEKVGYKVEEATLRLRVDIYGDKLGRFSRYLKVPEEFYRYVQRETSLGVALSMASNIAIFLLIIAAILVIFIRSKSIKVNWKFGLFFACAVVILKLGNSFNSLPLLWNFYSDTMSKAVFISMALGDRLNNAMLQAAMIFGYGVLGELLSGGISKKRTPLLYAIERKKFFLKDVTPILVIGYSLGFIFLGYTALFYLIGTKFFDIWIPPHSVYSNILGTVMPFLFPLTIAASAAIREEFMFRLFAISFFKKWVRFSWLAVFLAALIWGFSHTRYPFFPVYIRGIEVALAGLIFGWVFLKYGLAAIIIAHFVVDSCLGSMPLLKSHNPYFIISGLVVIGLASMPLLIAAIFLKKNGTIEIKKV